MTALNELPNRRVEGWRWSDLRAAMDGREPVLRSAGGHIIERLAPTGQKTEIVSHKGKDQIHVLRLGQDGLDARTIAATVHAGGSLSLVVLQAGGEIPLLRVEAKLEAGATFRQFVIGDGAKLCRIDTDVDVEGEGARIDLSGVYLAGQGRHVDLTSLVTLAAPGAEVRQMVRGVVRKGGRGVFQGKFKLERAAQKSDAQMQHNALLLEEGADIFAKPELEIYADDVQCAHGNTAGQMDEMAVFYLRSRGIPEAQARGMITRAFLVAALPDWLPADIRGESEGRIDAWLEGGA
jgi:Fe-S cluster assembly protein SufD